MPSFAPWASFVSRQFLATRLSWLQLSSLEAASWQQPSALDESHQRNERILGESDFGGRSGQAEGRSWRKIQAAGSCRVTSNSRSRS